MELLSNGTLNHRDITLLAIIDALVKPGVGCYASNDYLGTRIGRGWRQVSEAVAKLKKLGLIRQVASDGKRRYLETAWSRINYDTGLKSAASDLRKSARQGCGNPQPYNIRSIDDMSRTVVRDSEGFGIIPTAKATTTEFDTATATKLLATCRRYLGTSHQSVRRARVSTWAMHIARLRVLDTIGEDRISTVLAWYDKTIGSEFVPEVYSAASFRKKFAALERAYQRDTASIVITDVANTIATRLLPLHWPKGSADMVPAVVQVSLTNYCKYLEDCKAFVAGLGVGVPMRKLGEYLLRTMPPPNHFVESWLRAAHGRVSTWDDWGGQLMPYAFKPTAKRFCGMGRGWAEAYTGDPDRWGEFNGAMRNEKH